MHFIPVLYSVQWTSQEIITVVARELLWCEFSVRFYGCTWTRSRLTMCDEVTGCCVLRCSSSSSDANGTLLGEFCPVEYESSISGVWSVEIC
jgi:hypothetical protein